MSWYEKYKEARILIQQRTDSKGSHNKFWFGYYDPQTCEVHTHWGRIGTKGQSQTKKFDTENDALHYIDSKYREKTREGYTDKYNGKSIDQALLDQLHIEAQIVGASNKLIDMQWLEHRGNNFVEISVDRLYDPDCSPAICIALETRKSYEGQTRFVLLLESDNSYVVSNWSSLEQDHRNAKAPSRSLPSSLLVPIGATHPLHKMVGKVEEALGRRLSN